MLYILIGHSWDRIDPSILPESLKKGEGGFASSGSCIAVFNQGTVYILEPLALSSSLLISFLAGLGWKSNVLCILLYQKAHELVLTGLEK